MTPPSLEYTGLDVLETLGAARNYNRYLTDLVEAGAADARTAVDFGAGIGTFSELIRLARLSCPGASKLIPTSLDDCEPKA